MTGADRVGSLNNPPWGHPYVWRRTVDIAHYYTDWLTTVEWNLGMWTIISGHYTQVFRAVKRGVEKEQRDAACGGIAAFQSPKRRKNERRKSCLSEGWPGMIGKSMFTSLISYYVRFNKGVLMLVKWIKSSEPFLTSVILFRVWRHVLWAIMHACQYVTGAKQVETVGAIFSLCHK